MLNAHRNPGRFVLALIFPVFACLDILSKLALMIAFPFALQLLAWNIHYVGLIIHMGEVIVFELIYWLNRLLPVNRWLPLLIGLLPLLVLLGIFRIPVEDDGDYGPFIFMAVSAIAWILIGMAVHRQQLQRIATA